MGGSKTFGTLISRNLLDTCFVLKIVTVERLQWAARDENVQFLPQNFYIWDKKSIVLFWNHDFLSKGLFTNMSNAQSLVPLILDRGQQDLVGPSEPPENNPHSQRTSSRLELQRNGRFYVLSKSGFWTKSLFFLQKDTTEIR